MESYSVEAVLSAVDKNYSSTMGRAVKSAEQAGKAASDAGSKFDGAFQDKSGRWRTADGRFMTMKKKKQKCLALLLIKHLIRVKVGHFHVDILKGIGAFTILNKAVNIVTNSLGSAIGRFDALASLKVMDQMGFSTQDVAKSTETLKKVSMASHFITELTKSAQQFAILEKSASGGAETATALNDAFLASGCECS